MNLSPLQEIAQRRIKSYNIIGGHIETFITKFQLNHLLSNIIEERETYGNLVEDDKIIFDKLVKPQAVFFKKKTVIPFKKILLPNGQDVNEFNSEKKLALVGLSNCDIWALFFFLKEFEHTNLLPKRENILIIGAECKPDRFCFCEKMGTDKYAPFDIFIQEEGEDFSIFSGTKMGNELLKKAGINKSKKKPTLNPIREKATKFDEKIVEKAINDRSGNEEFWQGISNNCFGCGACSTVCPLCFCTKQEFRNDLCASGNQCLKWDSCFSKNFSEIQNHSDLRPKNVDRLYNWYHHKFVRAKYKHDNFLCTGCGRCIEACPANLNVKNILEAIINKNSST